MDVKETLAKLPLSGSLFGIVLAVVFFLCHSHDQKIRAFLYDYHGKHLLEIEAPIYDDFYSKRLAIEQVGSQSKLEQFRAARKHKKARTVSQFILLDRSFRPYIDENSPLFFTTKETENWQYHSKTVTRLLTDLSTYQFGLIPEHFDASPQFSRLLSYLFVDTDWLNLASNIILILCLFVLLEARIQRRRLWAALFLLSIVHGSLYLLFADALTSPLIGSNILVYFLSGLTLSLYLQQFMLSRKPVYLYFILATMLLWLLKAGLDAYYGFVSSAQLMGLILASLAGGLFGWPGSHLLTRQDLKNQQAVSDTPLNALSADLRAQYHEALTALTRFNFTYARSKLRQLITIAPTDTQLLDSSYHLEKLHPDEGFFWPLLEARIEIAVKTQNYPDLLAIFKDIQLGTGTPLAASRCIGAHYYLQMLIIFLRHNNLKQAEQAFMFLELSGDKQIVKDACQLLIEHLASKKLAAKQLDYQARYDRLEGAVDKLEQNIGPSDVH